MGIPVVPAKRLPGMLRQLPAVLGPERVAGLADQARVRFHAAAGCQLGWQPSGRQPAVDVGRTQVRSRRGENGLDAEETRPNRG
jgi:hypothetical protein